ncbi:hypothetical protein [Celeribacter halophilus]|uniref:Uncharacterized protein n=1 Tax=Celeribacter halophilus TaxID=576117 RepID=A0A1I3XAN7_9RHOB|nr:hypothetical protein [Celeribacter halophilus]PZX03773.1 hypothetical protein LX82_03750 [Celeribacter halophilus]SFK16624.1 hypothetical protein SAMN04488138_1467 [Celeribacter halophilus]
MPRLLTLDQDSDGVYAQPSATLEALWAEAESIGRVSVDCRFSGEYSVRIAFDNGKSSIFAYGNHPDISEAVREAIKEAVRMGAL